MTYKYLLILCLLISSSTFAEGIKFDHYSDDQGLSHNSVRHIVQDNSGLLWLGTFGGLNSFDGNKFTIYNTKSKLRKSINNDDITALVINRSNDKIWIGTRNGLTQYDLRTQEFETYLPEKNNPKSLPDREIRALYIDKFARVWVGTKKQGLCYYDTKTNEFTKVEIDGFKYIKSIFEDSNGVIWVGSNKTGGVAKITISATGKIAKVKSYNLSILNSKEFNPYVNFIYQDSKSDIFVGTREGLYKLDKLEDVFHLLPLPDASIRNLLGPYFNCVAQAPDGKYWLGTIGGVIVCDHLEDIIKGDYEWYYSVLSDESSLTDNLISALYFDKSGILWVGTENGLDKYDSYKNQFKSIKDISFFINDKIPRISGFAKTYDNNLIVSTHDNGLFFGKNNEFSILTVKYKEIASIYTSDGKMFYCGLWNGDILVYDYVRGSFSSVDVGFEGTPTFAFSMIKNGNLFIASHSDGVVLLDLQSMSYTEQLPGYFYNSHINQMVSDVNGVLWIADESGVIRFDPSNKEVNKYTIKASSFDGLSLNSVRDICIDSKGVVWVSTTHGLNYYDSVNDNFVPVLSPEELRDDWITDIRFGKDGEMWLNFNNNRIGNYNSVTKKLNIYHVNSGNRLDIFSNRGFLLFNDSLVYMPGKDGIIYFRTDVTNDNSNSRPPFITEVKVQNITVFPGDTINGKVVLREDLNYSKKMELDYINRNFSLSFSSPSYVNVRLNQFQYMLVGFDNEWITVGNNSRNIQYTNLYPGDYVFKIRARNSNGHWSQTSSYDIVIKPPFWMTYKSILLFILLLSLIFYYVYFQIQKRIKLKHELVLEKVKRERDEKLNNEKLRFFTNISHELRTPISLILGPAKQLIEEDEINNYQKNKVKLILNNSSRLMYLINQLLDFRKAQTGELRLKVSETDILLITENTFDSFKSLAKEKNINFHITSECDQIMGWIDQDKYDKILYNLLSNAIKFTPKHGHVDLFIGIKNDSVQKLVVEISDDGIGIPLESQKKIFSRFYQIEKSENENTGSGIGLSLVESLVKTHKASIEVRSERDKGSVFIVEIPIERESYESIEIFDVYSRPVEHEDEPNKSAKKTIKSTGLKEKILVIDDNTELRKFIAEYLSDTYKVYEAENGLKGLQLCRKVKPMLCIADIKMPVKDGFQFCTELKKDVLISHIPVVMLTALSDNDNRIKGYKLGADSYVVKPFDPSLLKTIIQNIIKSRLELKSKFSGEVESNVNILSHSPADEQFMNTISRLIEENIKESDLKIDFLCTEMGISSSKLYRKIKELTNLAPNEFIRTLRLKKSAEILKSKKYNVSEVSDMVGFNDPLYFSRCFKKQFGFSPRSLL